MLRVLTEKRFANRLAQCHLLLRVCLKPLTTHVAVPSNLVVERFHVGDACRTFWPEAFDESVGGAAREGAAHLHLQEFLDLVRLLPRLPVGRNHGFGLPAGMGIFTPVVSANAFASS